MNEENITLAAVFPPPSRNVKCASPLMDWICMPLFKTPKAADRVPGEQENRAEKPDFSDD